MKPKLLLMLLVVCAVSCTKHDERAYVDLNIGYEVNGEALATDTLCYTNEAGNPFLITEIQWFLSNVQLLNQEGEWHTMLQREAIDSVAELTDHIFYIDTDIPESQVLHGKKIPVGHYTALRFTFGLDETDNETGLYNDPPESDMFWPDMLGGGYHYMKLNGKFAGGDGRLKPLAVHLGIGQNENLTQFYQNYYIVELPINFNVKANTENHLDLTMVIDNWFRNPNTIDFNELGSGIMQNQTAQRLFNGNGKDVFKIGKPSENKNDMDKEKKEQLAEKLRNVMRKGAPQPHFWSWENTKKRIQRIQDLI